MGNFIRPLLFLIGLVIIVLIVFNSRYPFVVPGSKGWSIGYKNLENPLLKIHPSKINIFSHDSLNKITGNSTRFLADPFLFYEEEIYYIFFEHQGKTGPAKIGLLKSNDGLNYNYEGNVINENFHLSFPQVFKYNEDYYILPESAAIGHVVLYKAINFPYEWEISDTLIRNIKLKDPALLLSDSLNLITGIDNNWTQQIFKSDSFLGTWEKDISFKSRKGNEIRPAGNFFPVNGEWYLPFQNNLEGYGTGVSLYKLKKEKFEKVIPNQLFKSKSISWFNRGMHHLNINKLDNNYYGVYDGDKIDPEMNDLAWKSSIKYNLYDLYNLIFR